MEVPGRVIFSFVIVCVVSSFCVAIGIGGGILYVPLLGYLYSDVPKGVYLSKTSILMTSFIGASYHLWNDVAVIVKAFKKKRSSEKADKKIDSDVKNENTETVVNEDELKEGNVEGLEPTDEQLEHTPEETESLSQNTEIKESKESKAFETPRVHLVLSLSLIPFCILGSYLGTTFHFFAKDNIKLVVTVIVSLSLLVTILKLIMLCVNRKKDDRESPEHTDPDSVSSTHENTESNEDHKQEVESEKEIEIEEMSEVDSKDVKVICDDDESDEEDSVASRSDSTQSVINGINRLFKSYNNVTVHTADKRLVSFMLIVFCLLLYFLAIKVDKPLLYAPVFVLMLSLGLFYAVKTRLSFKPRKIAESCSRGLDKVRDKVCRRMGTKKAQKWLDAGVHYILLNLLVAFLSGFFSGSAGTGSGIFMVPLLQYLAMSPVSCSATSNFLTLSMSIATLSRFGLKVEFKVEELLPALFGSLVGTSLSLFLIRTITKDRISAYFVNATLVVFCISSIVLTWTI
ncbi:uncharacterized protein TOT_010000772 [Theileria orientalis strain Shintoku]|uniref:Membrane transporter protein n=1 Tax=Theileria orientalis strain Shintoku TaxID=869250 RepID=J4C7M8_THEOR|nr:uncharacterized protein TOT_010000772 [Theileria orientalis strain Shintoku]PVC51978.1 hypothetical protein MACL_00001096 [Theileria orientalis]BAM39313.1 uncharacterized protein TOT_010000772 [Theileria orientalis strain Shintoku]|eukprot:XP_009689614.1 uncharacterized protein TOT_010000772 [Theileria orientalis strain Shintoku]